MKKTPDIIFVVDSAYEDQAVKEAKSLRLPVYGICNTNSDPYLLHEAIPANTNSVKSLDYLATNLASALTGTIKKAPTKTATKPLVRKPRPAASKETATQENQ